MPLSEYEQRILKRIEDELCANDPKLAARLSKDRPRVLLGRRCTGGVVSMLVGLVMLVGGIRLPPAALAYLWFLPVGGYALMWAGLAYVVSEYPNWPVLRNKR
jgi:hypothetical protein